ncbi:hypothetical protein PQ465_09395 [Sphingobacterium oryzagri]|uniref:Uncharacterized protein n=1 Tax=Sphingobacterium oryzagri TaxID=3025669 RepID=A0ABY7WPC0_9SPHI|nr:hypothetical protein [Sphingobacterium sp. KACC 22765]WDF70572.1 hypothetical protein PQ465_09395 [Sphingobacterium sp. KACC 22765]
MSLLIKLSKIFEEDQRSPSEILALYGRTLTLKMIGVLNSMLQRGLNELPQQVVSWFGHEGHLGQQVMQQIFAGNRDEINSGHKLLLVNHYANLRMNIVTMGLDEIDENTPIDVDQSHLDLFKAYLKLNELFLEKQDVIGNTIPEKYAGMKRATRFSTASLISFYDFSYINQFIAAIQLVKAMYCLEFIEQYNPELYQLYLESKMRF